MRVTLSVLLLPIFLCSPATAKNPFDELNRALDGIGRILDGGPAVGQKDKNRTETTIIEGACITYARDRKLIFRKPCTAKSICETNGNCNVRYIIGKMFLAAEFKAGKLVRFWNQTASWVTIDGHACMMGQQGGISLCFVDGDVSKAGGQKTANPIPDVKSAERKAAEAKERRRAEAIELSRRLIRERDEKEAIRRQEAEAEEQIREQAVAEAELEKKMQLIAGVIGVDKIGQFFEGKTQATLRPIDAKHTCREHFMPQVAAIVSPVPKDSLELLRKRCSAAGGRYSKTQAKIAGERAAKVVLEQAADLDSLRANNWFLLNLERSDDFTSGQEAIASRIFHSLIDAHRREAIQHAKVEIRTAYRNAKPLTKSANDAWKTCYLPSMAPVALRNICKTEREKFSERVAKARCRQSIDQSSVSKKTLTMPFAASGQRLVGWPLRQVICRGTKNRPHYRIIVDESWIPGLRPKRLTIFAGKDRKVLEVELRVSSPRDGRSFAQLLIDIATGENERPVPRELVVDKILFTGPGVKGHGSDAIVGCTLGFLRCR